MLSDYTRPVFSPRARSSNSGFTLIELLTVIAVIAVLAAITFGISGGVQNAKSRTVAKAELAALSQAIEQFKLRTGDYPWAIGDALDAEGNAEVLFQALAGWMEFSESNGVVEFEAKTSASAAYIDISKLTYVALDDLEAFNPEVDSSTLPSNYAFLDPWGNPYVYSYKLSGSSDDWDVFGFHLYSMGPNGDTANASIVGEMEDSTTGVWGDGYRDVANENGVIFAGE